METEALHSPEEPALLVTNCRELIRKGIVIPAETRPVWDLMDVLRHSPYLCGYYYWHLLHILRNALIYLADEAFQVFGFGEIEQDGVVLGCASAFKQCYASMGIYGSGGYGGF
jgi:hypothetical protein